MKKVKYGSIPWLFAVTIVMIVSVTINGYSVYLMRFITDYGLAKRMDDMFDVAKVMVIILGINFVINIIIDSTSKILNKAANAVIFNNTVV